MTRRRALPWLVLIGVLVAALSLRGPIIAITPVLGEIIDDLGITETQAGLFTTAPVLMFALVTPLAALVVRRAGAELALLLSLAGVLVGVLVRTLPEYAPMLVGMLIIGASATIGNVVIPVILRRELPSQHLPLATGAYSATLNVGTLITTVGTAPIADALGWPPALLVWGVFTVAGLVLWGVHVVRVRGAQAAERLSGEARAARSAPDPEVLAVTGPTPVVADAGVRALIRRPVLWLLLASFSMQSMIYFGMSTWYPTMLSDLAGLDATAAGWASSMFQGFAIVGGLTAPLLLRAIGAVPSGVLMGVLWLGMVIGMLVAPEWGALWAAIGAIPHSAGFMLVFTALLRSANSDGEAATMSALAQGGGYLFASLGGPLLGAVHEASMNWTVPLLCVLAVVFAYGTTLVAAMVVSGVRRR